MSNIEHEIDTKILNLLPRAAKAGFREAVLTALKWAAPLKSEEPGLAWSTYRATVRRAGRFTNLQKEYNFNEDLAKPFMRKIDPKWNQVFNQAIYEILNNGIAECTTKIDMFKNAFSNIMAAKGMPSTVKVIFDKQLVRFVKLLDNIFEDIKKNVKAEQKAANRICVEIVQLEMKDAYEACKEERGTGCYMRMKNLMKSYLEKNSKQMFKEARVEIQSALQMMMKSVRDVALRELETSCESFNRDCGYLISQKVREFTNLDERVQQEIMSVLDKAKTAFEASTDVGTHAGDTQDAQREHSLPVRAMTPAAAQGVISAEPSQSFTATDWGLEAETDSESGSESDSSSEVSDILP